MKRSVEQKKRDQGSNRKVLTSASAARRRNASQPRVAIVRARFNSEITEELERAALEKLADLGVAVPDRWKISVPGAVEIPVVCDHLFSDGAEAVIALGCVIRGETTHYESVINAFETGASLVQAKCRRPIVYGVLTVENEEQAKARIGGSAGHKGTDAAEVAVEMIQTLRALSVKAKPVRSRR